MASKPLLDLEWEQVDEQLRVTVWGHFTAADHRSMDVRYNIDLEKQIIECRCAVSFEGATYRHQSVLRGFCLIPLNETKDIDLETCDWRAVLI